MAQTTAAVRSLTREFAQNRGDMVFDRLIADRQQFGDLFVAVSTPNMLQNFGFARGEDAGFSWRLVFFLAAGHLAERLQDQPDRIGPGQHVVVDHTQASSMQQSLSLFHARRCPIQHIGEIIGKGGERGCALV